MIDAPLVSVVTPAYNVGPWIGQAMDSVLGQKESRLEYVVVDDGSTDDTAAIVAERAARDPRVRLVQTENGGSGRARNVGLTATSAPFVAFLDGDDRWHPEFLSTALATFDTAGPHVGATFGGTTRVHAGKRARGGAVAGRPTGVCGPRPAAHRAQPAAQRQLAGAAAVSASPRSARSTRACAAASTSTCGCASRPSPSTPAFQGIRRWHVDMRLMRTGSISRDRSGRYQALEAILAEYSPLMCRHHPGLAYVRPAVFAYRDGHDEIGDRWAAEARAAGTAALRRSVWARRCSPGTRQAPPVGRGCARRATPHAEASTAAWPQQRGSSVAEIIARDEQHGRAHRPGPRPAGPRTAWISTVDRAAPIQPIAVSGRYVAARLLVTVGDVPVGMATVRSTGATPPPSPWRGR